MSAPAVDVAAPVVPAARVRSRALDALRGLAILCMVVDHVTLVTAGPEWLRLTVGRVAMPLFFVLSGHLARRLSWRHAVIFGIGLGMPLMVWWIDRPNVLVWYVVGSVVIVVTARWRWAPWVVIVGALGVYANRHLSGPELAFSYEPGALVGLMCLGQVMPREAFAFADRWPRWLAAVGRFPLSIYVGHLWLIAVVCAVVGRW